MVTVSFGGKDNTLASFEKAKIVVMPAPYGKTVSYKKGTENGPAAILDASDNMELFDDELKKETYKIGIHTKPPLNLKNLPPFEMVKKIKKEVKGVLKIKKMPVIIGGEHSVSIGAVWAASESFGDLSVLHLDAHHDLRNEYEGSKYNHACVARRFLEFCPVVQAGTRSLCKEERDFIGLNPPNLKIIDIYDVLKFSRWKDRILEPLSENVYLSLDLDVLDPSIMPSVGTPEPGGFGWYEFLGFLKTLTKNKKIIGFDVVELLPNENFIAPDFLAAKLIYRLLGYISRRNDTGKQKVAKRMNK